MLELSYRIRLVQSLGFGPQALPIQIREGEGETPSQTCLCMHGQEEKRLSAERDGLRQGPKAASKKSGPLKIPLEKKKKKSILRQSTCTRIIVWLQDQATCPLVGGSVLVDKVQVPQEAPDGHAPRAKSSYRELDLGPSTHGVTLMSNKSNDQRSNVHNPNSAEYQSVQNNRSRQLNPLDKRYGESRGTPMPSPQSSQGNNAPRKP